MANGISKIEYKYQKDMPKEQTVALYESVEWSSAKKPDLLLKALKSSHSVISAWDGKRLVGLGNAISDGFLVVYYPHLLVHPEYQGKGIGTEIVKRMQGKYRDFHQQSLIADGKAAEFYKKCGFVTAGSCQSLWIYKGHDHD
jgi:GNAT superfamily N-acetyltransferase